MSSYFKQCLGQVRQTSSSQSIHHTTYDTQPLITFRFECITIIEVRNKIQRQHLDASRPLGSMHGGTIVGIIRFINERHLNPLWWPISFSSIAHKLDLFEISNPKGLICYQNIPYLRCDETRVHLSQQSYTSRKYDKDEN